MNIDDGRPSNLTCSHSKKRSQLIKNGSVAGEHQNL